MLLGPCVALGIGLLVGTERERRKGRGPKRNPAGLRTFAVASLLGAIGTLAGGAPLASAVILAVGAITAAAYWRSPRRDPGMTTELSLLLVCLLGALAVDQPFAASAVGVVLAVLLTAREPLHRFVRNVLSEHELHELLMLCALSLILLPLAPDRYMGPFNALNPHLIARLAVMVLAVRALGFVAMRAFGPRRGLVVAGLAAGFASSTATVFTMGRQALERPDRMSSTVAGASLSSVATFVQVYLMGAVTYPAMVADLMPLVLAGGTAAAVYGLAWARLEAPAPDGANSDLDHGFGLPGAAAFAALMSATLLLSGALTHWLGQAGMLWGAALTGVADAHAATASLASLAQKQQISAQQAVLPVLAALSANTLTKAVVAFRAGGTAYGLRMAPGLVLMLAVAWGAAILAGQIPQAL